MADRVSAGIELAFDPATERRISDLWLTLEAAGLETLASAGHRQARPHLTVTVSTWLDLPAVRQAVSAVPWPDPLTIDLTSVGRFPSGPLWLGAVVTEELLAFHHAIHRALDDAGIVGWPYYRPGWWTPHCTLAMTVPDEFLAVATRLALATLPISGSLVAADLVRHTTTAATYDPLLPLPAAATAPMDLGD
jgi:hypothetical protein